MDIKSTGGINPANINLNKTDAKGKESIVPNNNEGLKQSSVNIEGSAKVNVSQDAKDINKIKQVAVMAPDVDQAKVAKFKELINSGKYKVDAEAIADKMVDDEMMMARLEN